MTLFDIVRRRLNNQLLSGENAKTPADVVSRLGGIQAQDYAGGEWSIGLRLPGSTTQREMIQQYGKLKQ